MGGSLLSQGRGDWFATCLSILKKVEEQLGQSLSIFNAPVDVKVYPEYTKYVDKPMDLGTIRSRLDKRLYREPQEYCNVRLCALGMPAVHSCHCHVFEITRPGCSTKAQEPSELSTIACTGTSALTAAHKSVQSAKYSGYAARGNLAV